jgi:hypothetical protein
MEGIIAHEGAVIQSGPTPSIAGNRQGAGGTNDNRSVLVVTGPITVNSATADPLAVANQIPAALQRKMTAAQVDAGQT